MIRITISQIIENFLIDLMDNQNGIAEIQRNMLANQFHCVPSQINYVIATRFTAERGYEVESRRGGGGYIKIRRVIINKSNYLMHIVNSIKDSLTGQDAQAYILNFYDYGQISGREANIMLAAVCDKSLTVPQPLRDQMRAATLKNMLIALL